MADEEPFQVEHLLDWRLQDRSDLDSPLNDQENRIQYQIKYKVHWKGYPDPIHDTWEPKSSFASPYYLKKEVARLLLLHPQTLEPPKVLERRSKELQNEYDKLHPTASAQAKKIKSKSKNNATTAKKSTRRNSVASSNSSASASISTRSESPAPVALPSTRSTRTSSNLFDFDSYIAKSFVEGNDRPKELKGMVQVTYEDESSSSDDEADGEEVEGDQKIVSRKSGNAKAEPATGGLDEELKTVPVEKELPTEMKVDIKGKGREVVKVEKDKPPAMDSKKRKIPEASSKSKSKRKVVSEATITNSSDEDDQPLANRTLPTPALPSTTTTTNIELIKAHLPSPPISDISSNSTTMPITTAATTMTKRRRKKVSGLPEGLMDFLVHAIASRDNLSRVPPTTSSAVHLTTNNNDKRPGTAQSSEEGERKRAKI